MRRIDMTNYTKQIENDWDWVNMAGEAAIADETNENVYRDEEDQLVISFYLGSFINPSGKYYMPWACSNVDPCPACQGSTSLSHKHTRRITKRHLRVAKQMEREEGELLKFAFRFGTYWEWPMGIRNRMDHLRQMILKRKPTYTCPVCHGVGSREAYEDECFWEALEEVANKYGGFIESGEGDPTDSFFRVVLDEPDEDEIERDFDITERDDYVEQEAEDESDSDD
jgi:hypothetical protein